MLNSVDANGNERVDAIVTEQSVSADGTIRKAEVADVSFTAGADGGTKAEVLDVVVLQDLQGDVVVQAKVGVLCGRDAGPAGSCAGQSEGRRVDCPSDHFVCPAPGADEDHFVPRYVRWTL